MLTTNFLKRKSLVLMSIAITTTPVSVHLCRGGGQTTRRKTRDHYVWYKALSRRRRRRGFQTHHPREEKRTDCEPVTDSLELVCHQLNSQGKLLWQLYNKWVTRFKCKISKQHTFQEEEQQQQQVLQQQLVLLDDDDDNDDEIRLKLLSGKSFAEEENDDDDDDG